MTTIMEQQSCEEHTFLFGSKKIRCYGSIDDLNSPSTSAAKISRILIHKVQSTDTLQKLELRYNSSMFEIKRLNKLWSSQSLHCKSDVLIPIFDEQAVDEQCSSMQAASTSQQNRQKSNKFDAPNEEESLDQLLKRIDMSMKRTKKAVKRFRQYTPQEGVEGE